MSPSIPAATRWSIVACGLLVFAAGVPALAAIGSAPAPRTAYLLALAAACLLPLLFARRINGRYVLLLALVSFYFLFYGAADVVALLDARTRVRSARLDEAELAVVVGILSCIGAYVAVAGTDRPTPAWRARDWPLKTVLRAGLLLWICGILGSGIWQVVILRRAWATVELGQAEGLFLTLARYLHPLGLALLAYATVVSRRRSLLLMMAGILAIEMVVGLVSDTKELAFRGAAILIVAKFLIEGRVPKLWIVCAVLVAVLTFPIFQAYRTVIVARNLDRGEAAAALGENLSRALTLRDREETRDRNYSSLSFLERSSLKNTLIMTIDRVPRIGEFQRGKTLLLYFTGFVPRMFWRDKPAASQGQEFNEDLRVTVRGVYISPTIPGELYWNFGWPGIPFGMAGFGAILGYVGRRFNLADRVTVTRFLVVTVTVYLLCVRFEDNIAMTFIVWTRSMAAIALLHAFLARRRRFADAPAAAVTVPAPAALPRVPPSPGIPVS